MKEDAVASLLSGHNKSFFWLAILKLFVLVCI